MFPKTRSVKFLLTALCLALPGCALVPNYVQGDQTHGSFIRQGFPFESRKDSQGRKREDTVDVARGLAGWELGRNNNWIVEISAAYKIREGGVYAEDGDKWMGFVTWGYRKRVRE